MATTVKGKSKLHRGDGEVSVKTQTFLPQSINIAFEKKIATLKCNRSEGVRVLLAKALGVSYEIGEFKNGESE